MGSGLIKELFSQLPDLQRRQLMLAFEQRMNHLIDLDDGFFLGVNLDPNIIGDNYVIDEVAGDFSYGRKKGNNGQR